MRDKSVAEIAGVLFPRAARVIATAPRQPRALSPDVIREIAEHPDLQVASGIEAALRMIGDGPVFITGSLFLVAEARSLIRPHASDDDFLLRPVDAV